MSETETPAIWVLHCEVDGMPSMVGWAASAEEADAQLANLRQEDAHATYTSEALTRAQADAYKQNGLLPAEA